VPGGDFELACERCGARYDLGPLVFGCPQRAISGLVSVLELERPKGAEPPKPIALVGRPGVGRYASLLPGGPLDDRVSLGEGGTPLVRSRVVGPRLGLRNLYFKNETANPTWSFKDRYVAVTVNVARSLGLTGQSCHRRGTWASPRLPSAGLRVSNACFSPRRGQRNHFSCGRCCMGLGCWSPPGRGVSPSSSTSLGEEAGSRSGCVSHAP
jgi:hypothetical protein